MEFEDLLSSMPSKNRCCTVQPYLAKTTSYLSSFAIKIMTMSLTILDDDYAQLADILVIITQVYASH